MSLPQEYWNLANRFMKFVSQETKFPVIICDDQGTIVLAIDCSRVGTSHAGAQKILRREIDEAAITAADAARNPLVKEGFSCPIEVDGNRVGTFGITGKLALARPVAKVASAVLASWLKEIEQQQLVHETADKVFSVVNRVTENSGQTTQKIDDIVGEMQDASQTALEKISTADKILDNIHKISQQSHILSINGAVEASRAGESGKAFGVIAQEMTQLASSTKETADNIQVMLSETQEAIQNVAASINKSSCITKDNAKMVQETSKMVNSLYSSIQKLGALHN